MELPPPLHKASWLTAVWINVPRFRLSRVATVARSSRMDSSKGKPMTVHYLVAGLGQKPNGGLRIIYEQARRLAERGHRVELHHFERFPSDRIRKIPRNVWNFLSAMRAGPPHWINLPDSVVRHYHLVARMPIVKPGDKVVATYWKTHELIEADWHNDVDYFYLIQGFETWIAGEALLHRQWRAPSTNLVVSKHLERMVKDVSGNAILIPNAVDFDFFAETGTRRSDSTILFCSMASANKGSRDIVEALELLHQSGCKFDIRSFGDTHPAKFGLSLQCEHFQLPSQTVIRDLYHSASLFVSASYSEGWGLTLAEATLCGCALLVSDADGHFEFLRPGRSALFFRRGQTQTIARKAKFLLDRPALRSRLNRNARIDLSPYTWERSIDLLERALGIADH